MNGTRIIVGVATVCIALLGVTPQLQAQQKLMGKGYVTYTPVSSETIELADGSMLMRNTNTGMIVGQSQKNPFDQSAQTCSGSYLVAADGSTRAAGYCEGMDAAGDVWWIWWSGTAEGGNWGILGGTGKFKGLEGGGTYSPQPPYPDGKFINNWEGSWTRK